MLPDMTDVLSGFSAPLQFAIVTKAAVDYEVVETLAEIEWFSGVMEPIPNRELKIKKEGQRTWNLWQLWTKKALTLDDIIRDRCGRQYRVMSQANWRAAGYYGYDLEEMPI